MVDRLCNLQKEIQQLEKFVARFKNTNRKYLKIKSIVEEIVNSLLTEYKALLICAFNAVIGALRMNHDRSYNIIFNNNDANGFGSNNGNIVSPSSSTYYQNQYYNNNNEYIEVLLEIATTFFNRLLKELTEKTMVAAAVVEEGK